MDKIRVMIVEDSPTIREFLCDAIGGDPRLTLVAACDSAEQALALLPRAAPDVISMDIQLPRMSGLEATRRIMETRPTPIVIVSQSVSAGDVDSAMNALRAGAVSAIEKPSCRMNSQRAELAARICRELVVMSQVKVVRQRFNCRSKTKASPAEVARRTATVASYPNTGRTSMVGIVASTGGPRALETIFASDRYRFERPNRSSATYDDQLSRRLRRLVRSNIATTGSRSLQWRKTVRRARLRGASGKASAGTKRPIPIGSRPTSERTMPFGHIATAIDGRRLRRPRRGCRFDWNGRRRSRRIASNSPGRRLHDCRRRINGGRERNAGDGPQPGRRLHVFAS